MGWSGMRHLVCPFQLDVVLADEYFYLLPVWSLGIDLMVRYQKSKSRNKS